MTGLAILGAAGRMGLNLIRYATESDTCRVAAAVERDDHEYIGQDAGTLAGISPLGVPLSSDLGAAAGADVWLDFTFHSCVPGNLAAARETGCAFLVGTTGLTGDESTAVHAAAADIPVLWAANMSLGMNLLFHLVRQVAASLPPDYDAEIFEMHHRNKKDAPSGTALVLAERLADGREQSLAETAVYGRHGIVGERPQREIGIHAARGGDIVGDHTVLFAGDGERIELAHRATSRDAFVHGALRAAAWLHGRAPGLYSMDDVLGLGTGDA